MLTALGATTFRLKVKGLTIFLETWLERPSSIPTYLKVEDVEECDYIFITATPTLTSESTPQQPGRRRTR